MLNQIGLGIITEVDSDNYSIKFQIPGVADDCIAYPLWGESEPQKDETIIWFRLDPEGLGESFIYKKLYTEGDIKLKVDKYCISINKDDGIKLTSNDTDAVIEIKDGTVNINNGHLTIK